MDRISQILKSHIATAEKQLKFVKDGVRFDVLGDDDLGIPSTEDDLMIRIANLNNALDRHEVRNANRT